MRVDPLVEVDQPEPAQRPETEHAPPINVSATTTGSRGEARSSRGGVGSWPPILMGRPPGKSAANRSTLPPCGCPAFHVEPSRIARSASAICAGRAASIW